jgi:hypothetical protein
MSKLAAITLAAITLAACVDEDVPSAPDARPADAGPDATPPDAAPEEWTPGASENQIRVLTRAWCENITACAAPFEHDTAECAAYFLADACERRGDCDSDGSATLDAARTCLATIDALTAAVEGGNRASCDDSYPAACRGLIAPRL